MERSATQPSALALVVVGLGLALAALLIWQSDALAAHADCTLVAEAPGSYYGVDTITSGSIECAARQNTIRFSIVLTRDGSVAASGERTCHKASSCWSYLIADDPAGDQVWCTRVSARVGSHSLAPVTRCETDPAL
jgi:hypothetical protein